MARQLVSHGHVRVDDKRVTIPSYRVSTGEVIGLTDEAADIPSVAQELDAGRPVPAWLEGLEGAPSEPARGRVLRDPARTDIDVPVDEALVVAYYAR